MKKDKHGLTQVDYLELECESLRQSLSIVMDYMKELQQRVGVLEGEMQRTQIETMTGYFKHLRQK